MSLEEKLTPFAIEFCEESNGAWRYVKYINEGKSAAVFHIESDTTPAALKIYEPEFFTGEEGPASIARVEAHKELIGHNCPYLIEIFDAGAFKNTAFVLMEFLPWDNLGDALGNFPNDRIEDIIRQVAEAAKYLEDQDLCHRDIKPENVGISQDYTQSKLLDLGVLRHTNETDGVGSDDDGRKPFLATVQYSSPEYLLREEPEGIDGFRALTFYQLGGVLHDLIMKVPLYAEEAATRNRHIVANAVQNKVPDLENPDIDNRLTLLARECLIKDYNKRLALVYWERFADVNSSNLEEIKARLRLAEDGQATRAPSGSEIEGHKEKLRVAANVLSEFINKSRNAFNLPPLRKTHETIDDENIVLQVSFLHHSDSGPVDIQILFQIHANLNSEHCEITLLRSLEGRTNQTIGLIELENPRSSLDPLQDRISETLLEEYGMQIKDAEAGASNR